MFAGSWYVYFALNERCLNKKIAVCDEPFDIWRWRGEEFCSMIFFTSRKHYFFAMNVRQPFFVSLNNRNIRFCRMPFIFSALQFAGLFCSTYFFIYFVNKHFFLPTFLTHLFFRILWRQTVVFIFTIPPPLR